MLAPALPHFHFAGRLDSCIDSIDAARSRSLIRADGKASKTTQFDVQRAPILTAPTLPILGFVLRCKRHGWFSFSGAPASTSAPILISCRRPRIGYPYSSFLLSHPLTRTASIFPDGSMMGDPLAPE